MSHELERLAATCLFPGFPGHEPPDWIRRWLERGLGGVVLYAWNVGDRAQLARLTSELRSERGDLLVAIDEEGGDVTRLEAEDGSSYPGNAALGAVDDVVLTTEVAASIGADLAAVGIDLDFAPVADVNTNPMNPIIGIRSFGPDPELVARHVAAFVSGLAEPGRRRLREALPGTRRHRDRLASRAPRRTPRPGHLRAHRAAAVPRRDLGGSRVDHDCAHRRARARRPPRDDELDRPAGPPAGRARLRRHGDDRRPRDARHQRDDRHRGRSGAVTPVRRRRALPRPRPRRRRARVDPGRDRGRRPGRPAVRGAGSSKPPRACVPRPNGWRSSASRPTSRAASGPWPPAARCRWTATRRSYARRSSSTSSRVRASPPARRPAQASGSGERCPSPRSCASAKAISRRSRSSTAGSSSSSCGTRTGTRGSRQP